MIDSVRSHPLCQYFHHSRQFHFLTTDIKGNCTCSNPLFLETIGHSDMDDVSFNFTDFLAPTDNDLYRATIKKILKEQRKPVIVDLQHLASDGSLITITWELQVSEDCESNAVIQYIGQFSQVGKGQCRDAVLATERHRAYEMSTEGLWRLELDKPAPDNITSQQLMQHFRRYGYLAECNDNMARMHGFENSEEMIGLRLDDIMKPEIQVQSECLRTFFENGFVVRNAETEEQDINGNRLYFLNNMNGIVEDGKLVRIWGTRQDITERKKAEEERLRSELFYRNLIGDSLDGMLLTDTNGIITFASPSVERILGFRPSELLNTSAFDYVHPDDQQEAYAAFQDEVKMEPVLNFIDVRLKTKQGEWLYCNVRGHNMLYNPYIGRMAIYLHDDSRRKEIEGKLKSSEQRFRQLIDNLKTGVVLMDENAEILISNRAAREILGISEEELPGPDQWNLIHEGGTRFSFHSTVLDAIKTGNPVCDIIVGVLRPRQEDQLWLQMSAVPVFDENENLLHMVCSFTDIAEQHKI